MSANSAIRGFLLVLMLGSTLRGQAQETEKANPMLAIVLDLNVGAQMPIPFSNIPEEANANMKLSPYLGLQLNQHLNEHFYLALALLYSQKHVDFNSTLVDQPYSGYIEQIFNGVPLSSYIEDAYMTGEAEGIYNLKYLELNFRGGVRISKKGALSLGIYLAYLLHGENQLYFDGTVSHAPGIPPITSRFQRTEDFSDDLRKLDFGFSLGFDRQIYKGLNGNIGFSSGLISVYQKDFETLPTAMVNMFFSFGLTYFPGKNILN